MHGRVKVRTSEEEKARKDEERQEKLKIFKHAMQKIQSKRKQEELDNELLELTGKVLSSNPDIYTLWNMRREIIIKLRNNNENGEDLSKLHDDELQLTEYCLKINPKSYCAWHQREWVLTTRPDPDWQKELDVCNKYLNYDERNFHTWDYRRFVVGQCKPPLKEEFDFTTEKIHDNFSNYSAWHYRSKMLVELYPDLEGGRPIEDGHHKHELKMVQSAAFTDPDDTSAWFYQRWLLGTSTNDHGTLVCCGTHFANTALLVSNALALSNPAEYEKSYDSGLYAHSMSSSKFKCAVKTTIAPVVFTITPSKTTIAFSKHVPLDFVKTKTSILINDIPLDGDWVSCTSNEYDNLWILKHNQDVTDDLDVKIEYDVDGIKKQIQCVKVDACTYVGKNDVSFQRQYSKPVIEELNNQLVACRQLLEMEPDNKWTLLTTTVFLHCINATSYHEEAIKNLHELKKIDKLRSGYYDDLITSWIIEKQLVKDYKTNDCQLKVKFDAKITRLPHLQYYSYCNYVDLSNQDLTSKVLPSLVVLQHCKILNLENNKLTTLKGFPPLDLEELNVRGNEDLDKSEVESLKNKNENILVIYD